MAAWTQGVIGLGYWVEVQLGLDKGRQESNCSLKKLQKIGGETLFCSILVQYFSNTALQSCVQHWSQISAAWTALIYNTRSLYHTNQKQLQLLPHWSITILALTAMIHNTCSLYHIDLYQMQLVLQCFITPAGCTVLMYNTCCSYRTDL